MVYTYMDCIDILSRFFLAKIKFARYCHPSDEIIKWRENFDNVTFFFFLVEIGLHFETINVFTCINNSSFSEYQAPDFSAVSYII